jgi:large subunit ribosomal protein L21
MYAVISLKGHQYIVAEGDQIVVDSLGLESGEITVKEVLSVFDAEGKSVVVGKPFVADASVVCEIVAAQQGEKLRVTKFVRKNRYQRTIGFRAQQTVLNIKKIKA